MSRGIINFPASISTPESFLDTKAKCPLDVRMQYDSGSAAIWSNNLPFFRHRRTWRTIKSHWQTNTFDLDMSKLHHLLITFTPYGGSSNVTSMYLSPLLAGSRARSCQKRKPKQHILMFTDFCQGTLSSTKVQSCWKNLGRIHLYLHKDLNRAFSNVQIRRTQISALIHRGGRV